jgi:predicted RNA-binding protein with PIN domain
VTRWIVDGMNVIGSRPDGWWRDRRGAMRRLVEELGSLVRVSSEPVTVVLDGRAFDLDGGPVEVRFASRPGPGAADDDIAAIVAADAQPGDLRVVTSDAALGARVREHGAEVEGAGAFRRRLDELGGGG